MPSSCICFSCVSLSVLFIWDVVLSLSLFICKEHYKDHRSTDQLISSLDASDYMPYRVIRIDQLISF